MNSEVKVKHGTTKVFVTIGTSLTIALVVSMLLFPDVWRIGVYAIIGTFTSVAGLYIWHTAVMMDAQHGNARIVIVPADHYVYGVDKGRVVADVPRLTDGKIVEAREWIVKGNITDAAGNIQLFNLPINAPALQTFIYSLTRGDSFAERTAIDSGLTREEFTTLRDELIDRGRAHWKHPRDRKQGVVITPAGMSALRQWADTPLPHQGDGA